MDKESKNLMLMNGDAEKFHLSSLRRQGDRVTFEVQRIDLSLKNASAVDNKVGS